jgi:hypothetical protein
VLASSVRSHSAKGILVSSGSSASSRPCFILVVVLTLPPMQDTTSTGAATLNPSTFRICVCVSQLTAPERPSMSKEAKPQFCSQPTEYRICHLNQPVSPHTRHTPHLESACGERVAFVAQSGTGAGASVHSRTAGSFPLKC